MSSEPRIFVQRRESDPDTGRLWADNRIEHDDVEYVRADIYKALKTRYRNIKRINNFLREALNNTENYVRL